MNVVVFGSTGGSGLAAVAQLLEAGHHVTAFARRDSSERLPRSERLSVVLGDVMNRGDVERAIRGNDAVVVTLGISENPVRVRFRGAERTASDVRSEGTANVIAAMRLHGVRRLVVQTSYGVGETRSRLRFVDRLFFALLLKPQIEDTERQEREVRASGLDWVIVQPVHLTDDEEDFDPAVSLHGDTERMRVSRRSVGRFLVRAVESPEFAGRSVAVSGARPVGHARRPATLIDGLPS